MSRKINEINTIIADENAITNDFQMNAALISKDAFESELTDALDSLKGLTLEQYKADQSEITTSVKNIKEAMKSISTLRISRKNIILANHDEFFDWEKSLNAKINEALDEYLAPHKRAIEAEETLERKKLASEIFKQEVQHVKLPMMTPENLQQLELQIASQSKNLSKKGASRKSIENEFAENLHKVGNEINLLSNDEEITNYMQDLNLARVLNARPTETPQQESAAQNNDYIPIYIHAEQLTTAKAILSNHDIKFK